MAYRYDYSETYDYAAYVPETSLSYIYGTAAEQEDVWAPPIPRRAPAQRPQKRSVPRRQLSPAAQRRQHQHASRMNALGVIGMIAVVAVICLVLVQYISLRARVTAANKEIASLESQLSTIRQANDETLNAINASISLDEIKYTAITKLGMTYASKNQIYTYEGDTSDYVHQVMEVGN